jgi:hypothetical protein
LKIQELVKGQGDDWFLLVHDGIQDKIATLLIESRMYYSRFGYLYYPEYISMFADPDATEVAHRLGKLIDATHVTFKHDHHSIGGFMADGVTAKHENPQTWAHGEKLFNERKARNFDLP